MSGYYDGLNLKLLGAIPSSAMRVLELGCANGRLGRKFKATHPDTRWVGVEISASAAEQAREHLDAVHVLDIDAGQLDTVGRGFDVIVLGDILEHLRRPEALLEALYDLSTLDATIVCCLPNMGHSSVIGRLLTGDVTYDDAGLLDRTHLRFYSAASAFKTFLNAGWLPHLADSYECGVEPSMQAVVPHLLAAAQSLGLPRRTAARQLGLYQMIITCAKWDMQSLRSKSAPASFSVIVPVTRGWQHDLNIRRSPGLAEVGADLVAVTGAASAADAFHEGLTKVRHPWVLLAHQDAYFATGTGYAIANELGALNTAGRTGGIVGFVGLHADSGLTGGLRPTGLTVDRTSLINQPASRRAVSMDECAVLLHRDALVSPDPGLGWHLWATDLCLQGLTRQQPVAASVLRIPIFHNSLNDYVTPPEFHASASVLLQKYPQFESIPTLCGHLTRTDCPA